MKSLRYKPAPCAALLISMLLMLTATPAHAEKAVGLFPGKAKTVKPGRYGKAAIEASIDVSGPGLGRKHLKLKLPDGSKVKLVLRDYKNRGNGNALWRGSVVNETDSDAVLTVRNGYLYGRVTIRDEVYEIRPGKQGRKHIVELVDLNELPECGTGDDQVVSGGRQDNLFAAAAADDDIGLVTIDLLTVYTGNARSKAGGVGQMEALIQAAVDASNAAFIESNMNVRFELVHTEEIDYTTQGDTNTDLGWITEDTNVQALRNAHGADMVTLMVDTPDSCGTAWVQRNPGSGFASYAYAATDMDCAVSGLTFAHEHGHNMGMEHNTENSSIGGQPNEASYPWSFGHHENGEFRTVMSYSSPCTVYCSRAARFSNPDILYNGLPTGIANLHDNAQTGNLTGPIIAAFRSSVDSSTPATGINVRIAQDDDDAEENTGTGEMYLDSSDLEFGYDGSVGSTQYVGLRFLNVGIPADAIITDAYLEFVADETGTNTTTSEIRAIAADSPGYFSTSAFDLSSRATTPSAVYWNMPVWDTVGQTHRSPDISALVQEVVDRTGWSDGNAMAFVMSASGDRTAVAWESSPVNATLLHVEYQTTYVATIDVLPGDAANQVYPNQAGKIPVVLLSTADFDATQIDPTSLTFGVGNAIPADPVLYTDIDAQFSLDAYVRFHVPESGISCNDTEVTLSGMTSNGTPFSGTDNIDASECDAVGCHTY